jgi:hypothetical protein
MNDSGLTRPPAFARHRLGVPERTAMALIGWSNSSMAKRYQHVTGTIRADVAAQVGGLLRARNETRTATTGDHADAGPES